MREHVDGDFPFAADFNALARALADDASVVSGCRVAGNGTEDMTLEVSDGAVRIGGTKYEVASQAVTLDGADGDDRYDLLVAGTDGDVEAVTGVPGTTPRAPSIPSDHAVLAVAAVAAEASGVLDEDVFDARALFGLPEDLDAHVNDAGKHVSTDERALWYAL